MKKYTMLVEVTEGNDEFWESLRAESKTGCDEILQFVDNSINQGDETTGMEYEVRLVKFEDI